MKQFVLIVAGGSGKRMGATIPKQYLEVNDKPIIIHTLDKFRKALPQAELFLVIGEADEHLWLKASKSTPFNNIKYTTGGSERFESVKKGLALINGKGIVGIHDAVRPFVSEEVIQNCFLKAQNCKSAIAVVNLNDSIRKVEAEQSEAVDRSKYKIVQTPQCFDLEAIKAAYQQTYQSTFTDDASVYEASGGAISLVEGNLENIKITSPMDLKIAQAFLS